MNSWLNNIDNMNYLNDKIHEKIMTLKEINNKAVDYYDDGDCFEIHLPANDTWYNNPKYHDECRLLVQYIEDELKIITDGLYWLDAEKEGYDQDSEYHIYIYYDKNESDDEKPGEWVVK